MDAQEPTNDSGSRNTFIPLLETEENGSAGPARDKQDERKTTSSEVQLPQELEEELRRLTDEFTVDTAKLKAIVKQFGEELAEGLKKTHQNIVCWTPTLWQSAGTKTSLGHVPNLGLWPPKWSRTGTVPYHRPWGNKSASLLDHLEGPAP